MAVEGSPQEEEEEEAPRPNMSSSGGLESDFVVDLDLDLRPSSSQDTQQENDSSDKDVDVDDEVEEEKEEERRRGYGCKHYKRRCALVAPCCNDEVFTCRLCHDEVKDTLEMGKKAHKLDRKQVKELVCLVCKKRQNVSNECVSCGARFGMYYCEICRLFDDVDKGQYHCEGCGICRVGGRENFWHCDTCQACFHKDVREGHVCVERSLHSNCPVCFEDLFTSTKQVQILPCGHPIHKVREGRAYLRTAAH